MDAESLLDIIERKAKGAFVRELGINDLLVVDNAEARRRARHEGAEDLEAVAGSWIRRIDGLDFSSTMRTAFEVKVSRSDWRRESEEKRRAWRSVTHRYIYVSPEGVIPVSEVPDDCGLWWVFKDPIPGTDQIIPRVQVMKKAPKNPNPQDIPWRVTMNLCYREQKLRNEIKRETNDYQAARRRGDQLLSDLKVAVPWYDEFSER